MAYRELELTLLSARELKNVNLFTRMDVYAVASISGDPMTRQCTPTDRSGGRNPSWNATFRFSVPAGAAKAGGAWLHVLLRSERALGDRDVGEVVVPLAELLAGADGPGQQPPRLASYQVHTVHRGEPRGVLNVSYRLGPVVAPLQRADSKPAVVGYPAPTQQKGSYPPQPSNPQPPSFQPQNGYYQPSNPQPPSFQPQNGYYQPSNPQQPFPPQNSYYPATAQQPSQSQNGYYQPQQPFQPSKGSYPASPQQPYSQPRKPQPVQPQKQPYYDSPPRPRHGGDEDLSPRSNGGHWPPTQVCVGPHTQIINLTAPLPRSNTIPAKADGPKPIYVPASTQPNASPVKADHSRPKALPQRDTHHAPSWTNVSPPKLAQAKTEPKAPQQDKQIGAYAPDPNPAASTPKLAQEKPYQPEPKALHQEVPSQPNMSPKKPDRSRHQAPQQQATQPTVREYTGKADSRTKDVYAPSRPNNTPAKVVDQTGPKAALQHERVPSMPTAKAS